MTKFSHDPHRSVRQRWPSHALVRTLYDADKSIDITDLGSFAELSKPPKSRSSTLATTSARDHS